MSFLSLVVTGNMISAMADKRDNILDTQTNKIYYDVGMINKLHQVGNYGFYAITGNYTIAKSFIDKSGFLNNFSLDGFLKSTQEFEHWFNKNKYLLDPQSPYPFIIYFGGMSKDNHVCAFTISSTESSLKIRKAKEGCYSYNLSDSSFNAKEKFEKLMRSFDGTIKSAQKIQYEMNKWVVSWNPSVSVEVDSFALIGK